MVRRVAAAPAAEDDVVELPAEAAAADDVVREDAPAASGLPERARQNEDGSVSLTLLFPTTLRTQRGGETIREERFEELTFHRITGADLRAISAASKESGLTVAFTRSTRLNPAIATKLFDKLDAADAGDALAIVGFFSGTGGRTGR